MARRVFFSFEYGDVSRAMVVRNSWVTTGRGAAGFAVGLEVQAAVGGVPAAGGRRPAGGGVHPPPVQEHGDARVGALVGTGVELGQELRERPLGVLPAPADGARHDAPPPGDGSEPALTRISQASPRRRMWPRLIAHRP